MSTDWNEWIELEEEKGNMVAENRQSKDEENDRNEPSLMIRNGEKEVLEEIKI